MQTETSNSLRHVPRRLHRPRRRTGVLLILLACLIVGGLAIAAVVRARPDPQTITLYACVADGRVLSSSVGSPPDCPRGSKLIRTEMQFTDPDRSIGHRLTLLLRGELSIPGVMAMLVAACLLWTVAGWRLSGRARLCWLLVPLLALMAAACVAGPGHWFPKKPYEGPSVIPLGPGDAITVLDLVGLTFATLALVLAVRLASSRWGKKHC